MAHAQKARHGGLRRLAWRTAAMCVAVLGLIAPGAAAQTWSETSDAGDLPATAQAPSGVGALTTITGTIPATNDNDVDMYQVCIPDSVTSLAYNVTDPQQFLFDDTGHGLAANDDIVAGVDRRSRIVYTPTRPGVHYLAISRWDREPASSGGAIFPNVDAGVLGPTGPGGGLPVSSWINAGDGANENGSESYTIDLSGAQYCLGFGGFFAPIDNDAVNSAKAGQTIPTKWRLTTADGTPVSDPASFVSLSSQSAGGECGGAPDDAIEDYSGNSGLQYLGDGNWQFNWKTPKSYAGQCRTMTLTLSDGTTHSASFMFR
jgi:hypothetical protein